MTSVTIASNCVPGVAFEGQNSVSISRFSLQTKEVTVALLLPERGSSHMGGIQPQRWSFDPSSLLLTPDGQIGALLEELSSFWT